MINDYKTMLHKGVLNLTLLILLSFSLAAQQGNYPQNYFAAPLEIPLLLSGNFGELRNNHFHAGIDIKTQGVDQPCLYRHSALLR